MNSTALPPPPQQQGAMSISDIISMYIALSDIKPRSQNLLAILANLEHVIMLFTKSFNVGERQ